MKILRNFVIFILVAVLAAAGVLWFHSRVINQRSFMAGFVDLFLKIQHRSDKFRYIDSCEAFIKEIRESGRGFFELTKAKFGVSLREERSGIMQAFIFADQEHPKQTVFYFHGGAYINQPNAQQRTMAARTAKETGCEVVLMVYPKMPEYDCETSYEACIDYYLEYIKNNDCGKIVFMGDSSGGGIALGMAEVLRDMGEKGPEELVLISPWVDATMSNPELKEYLRRDPMLGIDGLRRMGEVWAGDLPVTDPRVSPIYGDLSGLCHVTLTAGTWEVLYPDIMLLEQKLKAAGTECGLIVGERMIHCYPIIPAPEAKAAQTVIWAEITD